MNTPTDNQTASASQNCIHCNTPIHLEGETWIDATEGEGCTDDNGEEQVHTASAPETRKEHTWNESGFCIYCNNVHRSDVNARSTCSDGFTCTIPAEKPTEAEICREAGLQAAKSAKWNGWDWKAYQTSITRQNHHISKIEAHAAQLAEALRIILDSNRWFDKGREALAAYDTSYVASAKQENEVQQ